MYKFAGSAHLMTTAPIPIQTLSLARPLSSTTVAASSRSALSRHIFALRRRTLALSQSPSHCHTFAASHFPSSALRRRTLPDLLALRRRTLALSQSPLFSVQILSHSPNLVPQLSSDSNRASHLEESLMGGEEADAKGAKSSSSSAVYGDGVSVEECEKMIQRSFRTPMVKFLRDNLEKSGCSIGDNFVNAVKCEERVSGGYARGLGIMVCSNHVSIQDEVDQVVIHELIHAYDDCTAKNLDWTNCAHHACSEIRAGHLSGDCHFKRELLRGYMKLRGHEQDCVKRRVMKSVMGNPYCSEAAAKDAMEAVWDTCYNDTRPFDRAP